MVRRLIAGLILVGLAVGIWALWPREGSDPTPTTLPEAASSTTTTSPMPTTTTLSSTTTTSTSSDTHVVETVAEAESILRQLWFGWFEGIYNQDEERIKEVVGTEALLDSAREQFGVMDFKGMPDPEAIGFEGTEVLRNDSACLSIWSTLSLTGFRSGATTDVSVVRWAGNRWVLVSTWKYK
ncbi:MAG: hypothetical protein WA726_04230, partial [Acidimicrobiia bacterium]